MYNNKFTVLKGEEFWVNNEIRFPKGKQRRDGSFRTYFGPAVIHSGVIYENSDEDVRLAMRRLTCVRLPEQPGEHLRLMKKQSAWFDANRHIFLMLAERYDGEFEGWSTAFDEAFDHHADPHQKRELRIAAWEELLADGRAFADQVWVRKVLYKIKTGEFAKAGKYPRMIGDLGVTASLRGFRVTKLLKIGMFNHPLYINGGCLFFCIRPDVDTLTYVFSELITPTDRFFFVYFSDDSCISIRVSDGKILRSNLDIATCDASHGRKVFRAVTDATPRRARNVTRDLVKQCELPIEVRSRADAKNKILLEPDEPTLYSGSTLTTSINNIANIAIGIEISRVEDPTLERILLAATNVGYILKGEECQRVQDLQFLKHSPVLDLQGRLRPLLNLGVLLRMSGTCHGDLPGKGPLQERAEAFQQALLQGAYPRAHFPMVDLMRHDVEVSEEMSDEVAFRLRYKVQHQDLDAHWYADSRSVNLRYRLDQYEAMWLEDVFAHGGYRDFYAHPALDKILQKDYGLTTISTPGSLPIPRE